VRKECQDHDALHSRTSICKSGCLCGGQHASSEQSWLTAPFWRCRACQHGRTAPRGCRCRRGLDRYASAEDTHSRRVGLIPYPDARPCGERRARRRLLRAEPDQPVEHGGAHADRPRHEEPRGLRAPVQRDAPHSGGGRPPRARGVIRRRPTWALHFCTSLTFNSGR